MTLTMPKKQTSIMQATPQRIHHLLEQIQQGIYDKNEEMALSLLSALAGESILLLGPPGIAKSMIARRMKLAFKECRSFEYLMSRFSTPDEIFGPVSISQLKKSDRYERVTEGFLPSADVVFLDEIWKAGPAIQNALLTVMNERIFRNGDHEMHLPLKLIVAASNELPAKGEGLEAIWDRFLIRIMCHPIRQEKVFWEMLTATEPQKEMRKEAEEAISSAEYEGWKQEIVKVEIPQEVLEAISSIRQSLQTLKIADSELERNVYVSDRRWKHIVHLLRTSAWMQGRKRIELSDLTFIGHCLWNEPDEVEAVQTLVIESLFAPITTQLKQLDTAVHADLQACNTQKALNLSLRMNDHRDDALQIVDRFFYLIEGHGAGRSCIFVTDFKKLPDKSQRKAAKGIIYTDPIVKQRTIVRLVSDEWTGEGLPLQNKQKVTLYRDDDHIYINGLSFKLQHSLQGPSAAKRSLEEGQSMPVSYTRYEEEAESICNQTDTLMNSIRNNLFANASSQKQAEEWKATIYSQVAITRVGIRKLLYNEL